MFYCGVEIRKAQSRNLNVQLSSYININIIGNSLFWKKAVSKTHLCSYTHCCKKKKNVRSESCVRNGLNETGVSIV